MARHATKPATSPTETPEDSLPSLAEVLDRVSHERPRIITRGEECVIVLGAQEFAALDPWNPPAESTPSPTTAES